MMQVSEVSFERVLFCQESLYNNIDSIDTIDSKYNQYRSYFSTSNNSQSSQHKTKKHRSCISHEYAFLYIKEPKRNENSYQNETHFHYKFSVFNSFYIVVTLKKNNSEKKKNKKRYQTDSRSIPTDSITPIESIKYKYIPEYSKNKRYSS